ncbi:MAG: Chorismate mutase [Ignavibacteria bacterium]|nr:Chorismate mutase [Ignavibacteria bacterium]
MEKLKKYRRKLFKIDEEIIRLLGKRMKISSKIGILKNENDLDIEQNEFWNESSVIRKQTSESYNLSTGFIEELFLLIHQESIKVQRGQTD